MKLNYILFILVYLLIPQIAAAKEPSCYSPSQNTKYQLTGLFKAAVSSFNGLKVKAYGPNCWGGALMTAGILEYPRPVGKTEFWFWMNSPYCKALQPHELPRTGDIGSLFYQALGNYHSFVRIDDNLVFSKNGPEPSEPYQVQGYEEMFYDQYKPMAKICKGSEENLKENAKCEFKIVYHRCTQPPTDYISRYSELKKISNNIKSAENKLSRWINNHDESLRGEMTGVYETLGNALQELNKLQFSGDKEFAREALLRKIMSLLLTDNNDAPVNSSAALNAVQSAERLDTYERWKKVPATPEEVKRIKK